MVGFVVEIVLAELPSRMAGGRDCHEHFNGGCTVAKKKKKAAKKSAKKKSKKKSRR
jgi:hypothetical protein